MDNMPKGELFTRVYVARGAPVQDSRLFRNRLVAYLEANHYRAYPAIASHMALESGLVIKSDPMVSSPMGFDFPVFFREEPIGDVLNAITLIYGFLVEVDSDHREYGDPPQWREVFESADNWRGFVARALREENMAYVLDEKCGVHYFVDEEFEFNRICSVQSLQSSRYAGARKEFEDAHRYLDSQPPDTKASVRSSFAAVEVLARLIHPQAKNLHENLARTTLKDLALNSAVDDIERRAIEKIFDCFAEWVNALHYYRHGQGVAAVVAPSQTLALYSISTAAAMIRWLVEIDSRLLKGS